MARGRTGLGSIAAKTKDAASAAGGAIGQAALTVTHLAVTQARAAIALADHALYGPSRAKAVVRKRPAAVAGKAKSAAKKRAARPAASKARAGTRAKRGARPR
jgi:hypothetical protein